MILQDLQEETIQKIKSGKLTYRVNVERQKISVLKTTGNENRQKKEVSELHVLSFMIGALSALKRTIPDKPLSHPTGNPLRDTARKAISSVERKMFTRLTKEEVKKYGVGAVLPEVEKAFVEYMKTNNPRYIGFSSFNDDKFLRDRIYDVILRRNGFNKVYEADSWLIYSRSKKEDIYDIQPAQEAPKGGFGREVMELIKNR